MRYILLVATLLFCVCLHPAGAQNIIVNGARTYQTIHGLGVNINPQSWNVNPDAVKKVIDSLVNGLGCTSFRLMYDDCDWEYINDNNDPDTYNWNYYDSVYSLPRFTCVWNTVQYLNSKGISNITLSPDGAASAWMGGTKLKPAATADYAEMMASMVYYGIIRRRPSIHFSRLSPINETTCGGSEGTLMTPDQLGKVFSLIAAHLIRDKIDNVTLIGPDDCGGWASSYHAIVSDPVTPPPDRVSLQLFPDRIEFGMTPGETVFVVRFASSHMEDSLNPSPDIYGWKFRDDLQGRESRGEKILGHPVRPILKQSALSFKMIPHYHRIISQSNFRIGNFGMP
jgi:hypothetical protein